MRERGRIPQTPREVPKRSLFAKALHDLGEESVREKSESIPKVEMAVEERPSS
jgi:hypothetical protein